MFTQVITQVSICNSEFRAYDRNLIVQEAMNIYYVVLTDTSVKVAPWRRKWQPTPVFLPGESQGWGSLVGCCLWGRTESGTTEAT